MNYFLIQVGVILSKNGNPKKALALTRVNLIKVKTKMW